MRKGLTEIVLVLDRSGSMESIKHDAEGGLRRFVADQKLVAGEARLTFYRFDNTTERVFEARSLREVTDYDLRLEPRGATALLDAIGHAINEVGARLRNTAESNRPEHVVVLVVTDGEENASTEFPTRGSVQYKMYDYGSGWPYTQHQQWGTSYTVPGDGPARIAAMIKTQREQFNWQFIFIGCTEDALKMAQSIGISYGSTLGNLATGQSYVHTYSALSNNMATYRTSGDAKDLSFTAQQRQDVIEDNSQTSSGKCQSTNGNS